MVCGVDKVCMVNGVGRVCVVSGVYVVYGGGYREGGGGQGGPVPLPPTLLLKKKKRPADIAYDCQGISGPTSTIALAVASSSLYIHGEIRRGAHRCR